MKVAPNTVFEAGLLFSVLLSAWYVLGSPVYLSGAVYKEHSRHLECPICSLFLLNINTDSSPAIKLLVTFKGFALKNSFFQTFEVLAFLCFLYILFLYLSLRLSK